MTHTDTLNTDIMLVKVRLSKKRKPLENGRKLESTYLVLYALRRLTEVVVQCTHVANYIIRGPVFVRNPSIACINATNVID